MSRVDEEVIHATPPLSIRRVHLSPQECAREVAFDLSKPELGSPLRKHGARVRGILAIRLEEAEQPLRVLVRVDPSDGYHDTLLVASWVYLSSASC